MESVLDILAQNMEKIGIQDRDVVLCVGFIDSKTIEIILRKIGTEGELFIMEMPFTDSKRLAKIFEDPRIKILSAKFPSFAIPPNKVDVIISNSGMRYVAERLQFMLEFARILNIEGRIFIIEGDSIEQEIHETGKKIYTPLINPLKKENCIKLMRKAMFGDITNLRHSARINESEGERSLYFLKATCGKSLSCYCNMNK